MFCRHFGCMFIEITNNRINNLIRTKRVSHGTSLYDTKKGFQRVSNFATLMLHCISGGVCPMAFEWADSFS